MPAKAVLPEISYQPLKSAVRTLFVPVKAVAEDGGSCAGSNPITYTLEVRRAPAVCPLRGCRGMGVGLPRGRLWALFRCPHAEHLVTTRQHAPQWHVGGASAGRGLSSAGNLPAGSPRPGCPALQDLKWILTGASSSATELTLPDMYRDCSNGKTLIDVQRSRVAEWVPLPCNGTT